MDDDERSPLLPRQGSGSGSLQGELGDHDHHSQFCRLVGVRSEYHPPDESHSPPPRSLYARALKRRRKQSCTYMFTATIINTLLLTQVVLGAALTGLGASDSSRVLITIFGAANTIIAGVIAFLKSRGQPVRARMFRDDLSRVVDEIENSAVMWYGISSAAHGYDAIDIDEEVTVRSEVARLTRLYDKAVKTNTMNDPDMYSAGTGDSYNAGLRKSHGADMQPPPGAGPPNIAPNVAPPEGIAYLPPDQAPVQVPAAADPDASPASKPPEPPSPEETPEATEPSLPAEKENDDNSDDSGAKAQEEKGKEAVASSSVTSPAVSQPAMSALADDPDASPASAARLPKKEDSQKSDKTLVESKKS